MSQTHERQTVVHRFDKCAARYPDTVVLSFVDPSQDVSHLTYSDFHELVSRAVCGLMSFGLQSTDVILIATATTPKSLAVHIASLCLKVVPVWMPRLQKTCSQDDVLQRSEKVSAKRILVDCQEDACMHVDLRKLLIQIDDLFPNDVSELNSLNLPTASDIAHLQFTSGTTAMPKVAIVKHRNITANVDAIGRVIGRKPQDRIVSWLPLFHDMGLICFYCMLQWQVPLVLTDSSNFVRHPIRYWLELISRQRGTISPAPTSAYQVCNRLARRRKFDHLDLSNLRIAFCGAEPVYESTINEFSEAFKDYGFYRGALLPVYGLAEATLAVSIPTPGEPHMVDRVESDRLELQRLAVSAQSSVPTSSFVSVGHSIPEHEIRIVDEDGNILPDRHVGEIEFRGPSKIDGYLGEPQSDENSYLRTGDLGYVAESHLYICGRSKDIIVHFGRNIIPTQVEKYVQASINWDLQIAAVGVASSSIGTEEIHLLIESRELPPKDCRELEERIREGLSNVAGISGLRVHWVGKGTIPRTTAGKTQRHKCKSIVGKLIESSKPQSLHSTSNFDPSIPPRV